MRGRRPNVDSIENPGGRLTMQMACCRPSPGGDAIFSRQPASDALGDTLSYRPAGVLLVWRENLRVERVQLIL